jgi:hypothetical protein
MRRLLIALALVGSLMPASALAGSWSVSTPWGSWSGSADGSSVNIDTSGSLSLAATNVDWSFLLDKGSQTVSGSATVNGQDYAASLGWGNLFDWLFF